MRTTLDLPDDLHRIVSSLASHTQRSLSQTASELMRRGLQPAGPRSSVAVQASHPATGLPLIRSSRIVTPEDVRALEDD